MRKGQAMNKAQKLYTLWYGVAGEGEPTEGGEEVNWESLFDAVPEEEDDELKEKPVEGSPAPVETPPADDVTNVVPQPEPVANAPKEEVITPEAPAPKPTEEAPKPPVEQPKQLTEAEQQAQLTQLQGELEGMYGVSKEEADLLMTEPEKVLPKLAAKVHLNIMRQMADVFRDFQQSLPQVVEQTTKVVETKQKAANDFSARWPGLIDTPEGQQAAVQAAQIVRSRNPKLSLQEVIEQSGRIAYSILGKDVPVPAPTAKQGQSAQKPKPHIPAATKSAGTVQTQQLSPEEAFYASLGGI